MHFKIKYSRYRLRDNVPDLSVGIFNRPLQSQNCLSKQKQSPFEASNSTQSHVEANVSTHSRADVHKSNQSAIEANPANKSPVTMRNTDLPIVVEPVEAHINANKNMLWLVKYKEFSRVYTMTKI